MMTEGLRVNFVMCKALFENLHMDPLSFIMLWEKKNPIIEFLYLYKMYYIEIRLTTGMKESFLIQNWAAFRIPRSYVLWTVFGRLKNFLIFRIAEITGSVNIRKADMKYKYSLIMLFSVLHCRNIAVTRRT